MHPHASHSSSRIYPTKTHRQKQERQREMSKDTKKKRGEAVIVGGSIAGVSCAHALILAGWDVVVIDKCRAAPKGSPTGAGLGLDSKSLRIMESWLPNPHLLKDYTWPLTIDQNLATDKDKKVDRVLTRDENFNFRSGHWADLHGLLYNALPPEVVLWGHLYLSFCISEDKSFVNVKAKVLETNEIVEIDGDLLVAADGSLSSIRQAFLPELKLRYSGYCAWRGVLHFSGNEISETISGIRKAYSDLGNCLYVDLSTGSHTGLYELFNKRLNWIWYVNQPEPELKGNSVTMKVSSEMIESMYREAEKVWVPELVRVMKDTKEPFINAIYDLDPLEQIFWDNVVLVGDAAHPTTPHCLRSTNMSILDAASLGKCLEKWGAENLHSALKEYQSAWPPVTSKQVLHARRLGRIKQGLTLPDCKPFDLKTAGPEDCEVLKQRSTPFSTGAPVAVD